ncbi:TlpA family protein disulfide reductase [Salipiger sp. P9]|uniref:TlpA disulfide reductase family protein n=1 Tax=Salipiger pentaromativorans TaxID=2943193 RepID=UPI00215858CA|nr:TlpA disulfide reductase family protein [Salipiger pentaromativorans]MCR8547827.1 TlpA family protein disulfide reductase [Salipiger pentaromativorans]
MNAVSFGPVVFDGARFVVVVGIGIFLLAAEIADRWLRRRGRDVPLSAKAGLLVLVFAVAARVAYVLGNLDSYLAAPLDVLRVWQGGFSGGWGLAATAALAAWSAVRTPKLALPLASVTALGLGAALVAFLALPGPRATMLPELVLRDLDGTELALAEQGAPLVLNLWASWCPPCRRELPMMIEAAESPGAPRFVFANQGEGAAQVAGFLARGDLSGAHMALDPQSALMQRLGARGLPATLFFDASGRLVASHTGEISRAELTRRMAEITEETP